VGARVVDQNRHAEPPVTSDDDGLCIARPPPVAATRQELAERKRNRTRRLRWDRLFVALARERNDERAQQEQRT
jgi:hypothetical protein